MAAYILIILALILANGLFSMSELAVVSSRRGRLMALAEAGTRGAATALALAEDPGRFLSTVQIGITLVGIVAGAFGGAALAEPAGEALAAALPALAPYAEEIAFTVVVAAITYLSLIVGELIPKQLALRNPERVAVAVARPMAALSRFAGPLVWLLDASTTLGLRLLGKGKVADATVTEEEVRTLIAEGTRTGVFMRAEKEMIDRVLRLADRKVRAIMTPRVDVVWLDVDATPPDILAVLRENGYSRYPVGSGGIDEVLGVVQAKDILDRVLSGGELRLADLLAAPPVLPDSVDALRALEVLKGSPVHMALVVDEYGSLEGIVTAGDLLEAVVGEMADGGAEPEPPIVTRADGSWLVDGGVSVDDVKALLGLAELPEEQSYHTLAGFVLHMLRKVPEIGEAVTWDGFRFEVVDMDGRRIDRVLVAREPEGAGPEPVPQPQP